MATTAAMIARARRTIVSHFTKNNAVVPEHAIYFVPGEGRQRRTFDKFLAKGVIVEPAPDNYFLDVPRYEEWNRKFHLRVAAIVLFLALAVAVGVIG